MIRTVSAFVAALSVASSLAGSALAAAPACFPERTVLLASPLTDDQGRVLGGIRAGQIVRVLDEKPGAGGTALVEIDSPVKVRGHVRADMLRAFLKRDVAVEKGRLWWLAGTPVRLEGGAGARIGVSWVGPHGEPSQTPIPRLSCGALTGRPVGRLEADSCHGARPAEAPAPTGRRAHFREGSVLAFDRMPYMTLASNEVGIIRVSDNRAYVEVIEADPFGERLRKRAWVSSQDVVPGAPESREFTTHLCCEAFLPLEVGTRGGVLERAVELRAAPDDVAPFAWIPAGLRFRVLGSARDGFRQIVLWFPEWNHETLQMTLVGWVPETSLPEIPAARQASAVIGRLVVDGDGVPGDHGGFEIAASASAEHGPPSARADKDGRFVIDVEGHGLLRLDAWSLDGKLAGAVAGVSAFPGGNEEVTLHLSPAATVEGRVRNRAGAWLPQVEVLAAVGRDYPPSIHGLSDARGRFRLPVVAGDLAVTAFDPGTQWEHFVFARAPAEGLVVELWRRRVVLGAVPRRGKSCAVRAIEIVTHPSSAVLPHFRRRYPVGPDCTFAAEDVGRSWNPLTVTGVGASDEVTANIGGGAEHREDPEPICVGGGCEAGWQRASVHINVVDGEGVLLATPTTVEVMVSGAGTRTCEARRGTCFVHGLAPGSTVRARIKGRPNSASGEVKLETGVRELLMRVE